MEIILRQNPEFIALLEENMVVLAYLFGSRARKLDGLMSDLDIAVLFCRCVPRPEYFRRELKLAGEIDRLFGFDKTDIINLASCRSPLLKYEAVFRGEEIFVKDRSLKYRVKSEIMKKYEDTNYLRSTQFKLMQKRLQEDRFGCLPLVSEYARKYVPFG